MYRSLSVFLLIILPFLSIAQTEEATTESGKKVILYPDGTWKLKPTEVKIVNSIKTPEKKEEKKKTEVVPSNLDGNCTDLFESVKDKNNTMITRTKNFLIITSPVDRSELDISMQKGAKNIITISFRTGTGNECIGEGNRISLVFSDASKLELTNEGPANCRGEAVCNFWGPYGKKKQLQELRDKNVRFIKIWTQQSSFIKELSAENQEDLRKLINCLAGS